MKYNPKTMIVAFMCAAASSAGCGDDYQQNATPSSKTELTASQTPIMFGTPDKGDPAIVGLYTYHKKETNDDGGTSYYGNIFCTGTLIHKNWVLTAAHCVVEDNNGKIEAASDNDKLLIYFGNKRTSGGWVNDTVEKIIWHPDYKKSGHLSGDTLNDVALIKLKESYAETPDPILPHPKWLSLNSADMPVMMKIVGFGFDENGNSETKIWKSVAITNYCGPANPDDTSAGCKMPVSYNILGCHPNKYYCEKYGNFDLKESRVTINYKSMLNSRQEGAQCNGDSGGPSLYTIGGVQYVSGVTSWGDTPCRTYNISQTVQDFYDWILEQAPEVGSQYREICGNGVDDDGNGKIDDADPACIFCGNNIVNIGEQCDGKSFSGGKTACAEWNPEKYASGSVSCNSDCTVNYDACKTVEVCGDGILSRSEACDGTKFKDGIKTCAEYNVKYTSGNISCNDDCTINTKSCVSNPVCGDGKVNGTEVCDGTKFLNNRYACNTLFPELYSSGRVTCTAECEYDTSGCTSWCGNGSINAKVGELCDGTRFGGKTCETLVGKGSTGTLKCINGCTAIDTSGCSKPAACGDGKLDSGEECDLNQFEGGKMKCSEWDDKYAKGNVSCNDNCTIDYGACEEGPQCGNGSLDKGELCDGTRFSGNKTSCKTLFPELYSGGNVSCSDKCEYDTSNCTPWCGNGSVNTKSGDIILNEACDHGVTDKFPTTKNTCEKVVGKGSTGTLICADDCKSIITVGCSEPAWCGDGKVNNSEQCDGTDFIDGKSDCAQWNDKYLPGSVQCTASCSVDMSQCKLAPRCGDGIVNGNEECDGVEFAGSITMCADKESKYSAGRLGCTADCKIDLSACQETVITPDEICDNKVDDSGNGLIDCADPVCASDEACKPKCGDGIVNGAEECDGDAFLDNKTTCSAWMSVFKAGNVSCSDTCRIVYDECSTKAPEICDNKVDDNGDGRVDCDDVECINFTACIAPTDPGTDPGTNPGTDPGSNPGTDPGTDPGTNPGTDPGSNPGTDPGTDPGSNPGTDPGTPSTPTPDADGSDPTADEQKNGGNGGDCTAAPLRSSQGGLGFIVFACLGLASLIRRKPALKR